MTTTTKKDNINFNISIISGINEILEMKIIFHGIRKNLTILFNLIFYIKNRYLPPFKFKKKYCIV